MYHLVAHATGNELLFHDWTEATELWHRLVRSAPGLTAMCIMPDHYHLLHQRDVSVCTTSARNAWTRWRNARRGVRGVAWQRSPTPVQINGRTKQRRQIRYVHLNPCRAGITTDPLAWPLSTHLDVLGLTTPAACPASHDPLRLHTYTCGDPTVHPRALDLPVVGGQNYRVEEVVDAVSVVTRRPASEIVLQRGAQRALLIHALRTLTDATARTIGVTAGVSTRTVLRASLKITPQIHMIAKVASTSRFIPPRTGTLSWALNETRYRRRLPLGR